MQKTANLLEYSLLVIWNNRNADARLKLMEEVYAQDIIFYESNEGPAFEGFQSINGLIEKLQSQWPATFAFELTASRINHQVQQITWKLGNPGEPPVATGMDIAIIEHDRIKSLHLLLNS